MSHALRTSLGRAVVIAPAGEVLGVDAVPQLASLP